MIRSFGDTGTADIFNRVASKQARKTLPAALWKSAKRKLEMIHFSTNVRDLKNPPGNHLEKLEGDLANYWSIRVNDQWRIIFQWSISFADKVQIIDYHK